MSNQETINRVIELLDILNNDIDAAIIYNQYWFCALEQINEIKGLLKELV